MKQEGIEAIRKRLNLIKICLNYVELDVNKDYFLMFEYRLNDLDSQVHQLRALFNSVRNDT